MLARILTVDQEFIGTVDNLAVAIARQCVGNRLAELQLQIIWEEIVKRFHTVEVTGEAERTFSNIIHGFTKMPVILHAQ